MAQKVSAQYVQLAQSLPPRLLDFFRKHPPTVTSSTTPTQAIAQPTLTSLAGNTSSQDANAVTGTQIELTIPSSDTPSTQLSGPRLNPFLAYKHPLSGAWIPPAYSLRRQSELIKLASQHNVLPLLPWSRKLPSELERKRIENGLRVKGTGTGQKVKGKAWERTLKGRLDDRRKAMEGMGEMVRLWKERGHGRGWKKWPK